MLDHFRIVLVNTSHPGNIGSVARAMKTMGLAELYLVSPVHFPHAKAYEMASGASEVLDTAVVVDTLTEALLDCNFVIGTSARARSIPWPLLTPRNLAEKIKQEHAHSKVAIVFGREQSGLTNKELESCHMHVQIPANPNYSSLNIASAVQIIAYELRLIFQDCNLQNNAPWDYRPATMEEMERFFKHLQEVLIQIGFLKMNAPRRLMRRMRRLFLRAQLDAMEMNMLRGMLTAVQENNYSRLAITQTSADEGSVKGEPLYKE